MYKYQEETLAHLEESKERLEKLTNSKMSIKIGIIRGEYLNASGTKYYEETRDLYFCINNSDGVFMTVGDMGSSFGINDDDFVKLDSNIFIKLNEFIDKIYKNKKEREEFHERLNRELEALNKSL